MSHKGSFVTDLNVSPLDGRRWRLKEQFTYERWCRGSRDRITVPRDFITDFASFPLWRFLFWWLPMWAKYNKASVLHDYLYRYGSQRRISRYWADFIFHEAMLVAFRKHKSGEVVARLEFYAVRLFGWLSYRRNFNADG